MGTREKLLARRQAMLDQKRIEAPEENFTNTIINDLAEEETKEQNKSAEEEIKTENSDRNTEAEKKPNKKSSAKKERAEKHTQAPLQENTSEEVSGLKLKAQLKQGKTIRSGFSMTPLAYDNIKKYAKECGYRSINDFVNELFESLDTILK